LAPSPVGVAPDAHGEALDRRLRGPVHHVDLVATAAEILPFDAEQAAHALVPT
jgi:hypothetical protein